MSTRKQTLVIDGSMGKGFVSESLVQTALADPPRSSYPRTPELQRNILVC